MSTQSEVLEALRLEGFTENLSIDEAGLVAGPGGSWAADDVVVDHIARFEGMSDPDDEAILLAVTASDGTKGTLTLPYGPDASGDQADAMRSLLIVAKDAAEPPDGVN